jgi:hypothetical protein
MTKSARGKSIFGRGISNCDFIERRLGCGAFLAEVFAVLQA